MRSGFFSAKEGCRFWTTAAERSDDAVFFDERSDRRGVATREVDPEALTNKGTLAHE